MTQNLPGVVVKLANGRAFLLDRLTRLTMDLISPRVDLGSNPSRVSRVYSLLAQSVERLTVNQNVAGSSPAQGAKTWYCMA